MASSGTITGSNTPGRRPRLRWSITSQSQANNTSTLQIIVDSQPVSGYTTWGTFSGTLTVDGTAISISGSVSRGSTNTIQTVTRTITHNANGNKTVAMSLSGGISGTTGWPTGYSMSGSAVLDRIPKAPSTPATPTTSNVTSSSFRANLASLPANNGATITNLQWQRATNSGFTSGTQSASSGTTRNHTFSGLAANTTYWVRVRAQNSVGYGPWSSGRQVTTAVSSPNAPTNVQVQRNSDTSHRVSWTRNATTAAPYASQRVQRRVDTGTWSGWATIATVSGTATNYTDTSTVANREYLYRVVAVNAGGTAASEQSAYIRTTPAAPTSLSAEKVGDDIRLTGSGNSPAGSSSSNFGYQIQDNPGAGGWAQVADVNSGNDLDWTHTSPNPALTHVYRARARVGSGTSNPTTLYSPWSSNSNTVQLQAAPNAPTLIAPTSGAHDRDASTTFTWQHNPVDTTSQSEYELRWRLDSGAWTTLSGTTAQSRSINLGGLSGLIEWQVRTKGAHPDWSPWSALGAFTLAAKPTATIDHPEPGEYPYSQINPAWGYFCADDSPQSQWQAQIRDDDGGVIEGRSGSTSGSQASMSTILADQTTYVIAVRVRSASGLWSDWDEVEITTSFPLPQKVEIAPTWDRETGSISLGLTPLDPVGDEMPVEYVTIQRRIDGGEWVTLATEILPDDTVTDHLPIIGGLNEYRAISWTSLPSSQASDIYESEPWHHYRCSTYINTGDGFTEVGTLRGHQATDTPSIEAVGHHFAGRAKPVAFFGDAEDLSIGFTGTIWDDTTSRAEWMRLLRLKQLACYRDCQGRRHFGIFGVTFSQGSGVQQATLTLMEMDHTEGIEAEVDDEPVEVD